MISLSPTSSASDLPLDPSWSYSTPAWQRIEALGNLVDQRLHKSGVRLTMGGEPTFVSATDFDSLQWRTEALGSDKRRLAEQLLQKLQQSLGIKGSLLQHGLGKLYPGEHQPRWALGCYWRDDSVPLWTHPQWLVTSGDRNREPSYRYKPPPPQTRTTATNFAERLIAHLGISPNGLHEAQDRTGAWAGLVIPLLSVQRHAQLRWSTCRWEPSNGTGVLSLLQGNSPIGLRLPFQDITWAEELEIEAQSTLDDPATVTIGPPIQSTPNSICVALGIEVRDSHLCIFIPPLHSTRSFVDLIGAIEQTAVDTSTPIVIEGYSPPSNAGISGFQIAPDPGVIEVNIHPATTWPDLVAQTKCVYDAARTCGLSALKPTPGGYPTSTGGGAHITIGGSTVNNSPLLRRPDLLRSLLSYWQNHPSLSYLFTGLFVGPTSQAPRLDESRLETLYELDIAFQHLEPKQTLAPEVVDSLLAHLLVDASGNTHRTALCVDKLYPKNNPRLQLGLLEFRGFAMPPTVQMRLLQLLLVRSLVAMLWQQPYTAPLIRWGTQLHDRFLLPDHLFDDLQRVLSDLDNAGMPFQQAWFEPFLNFRFPQYGVARFKTDRDRVATLELRQAIEPWNVIGPDTNSGTARTVDASLNRIQVKLNMQDDSADEHLGRYRVTCNHHLVPLTQLSANTWVGGVRFRARSTPHTPATAIHRELIFTVIDSKAQRALGSVTYFPNPKRGHQSFRVKSPAHTSQLSDYPIKEISPNFEYPSLLDLRRVQPLKQ
ncbi:MAG: transglutaminase family protein [Synechococcus sp.]